MDVEATQIEVGVGSSKEKLEPLLSKSEVSDEGEAVKADDQPPPLPYYPGFGFVSEPRPYRDIAATVIFVIFVLASVAWGIFCVVNHNEDCGLVDSAMYNSSSGLCYSYSGYSSDTARIEQLIEFRSISSWPRVSKFSRSSYCQGEAATDCCSWSVDKWVPVYYILTIFTLLWSILLMTEAQVYVLSSTIAQWYFTVSGSKVTGSIRQALKHAFGPSFGTVTFSGLVVAFVRMIRAAVDSSQNAQGPQGCFIAMLRCCVNFALISIEFLNKFTINFAAITGENYCNSAKLAYDLLKRNLLSPVLVEVISTRLLGGMVFVLSVVYAVVVCAILRAGMNLGAIAYYVTALAWLLLFVIFLLFCQVLDNIIDTVYICYAIDKDSGAVSKLEVHDVYLMLPVSRDQPPALAVQQA
ncbi:hypothetical protein GOP47_0007402 [Adiantum capillus-veneris]|uniref:Choline transporter-like protein n=1 Tax=Adiantum capillus-veneris TaxID=13818 RepID=A0A9D4V0T9_ADICA|nr:hypothetical protein GOP47_0007402 [Adiantum capillus-veneris]